jgi:Na+/melibiose symporter-like transporter
MARAMLPARNRSAGVTAAATLAVLGSVIAFFLWGWLFLPLMNLPPDSNGQHAYQVHPTTFALIALVPPFLVALGLRTGMGLFQLRLWARKAALWWASIALAFCLSMIALRPFETFAIPEHFVTEAESMKQLLAVSAVFMLLPVSIWWLFFFRLKSVLEQFEGRSTTASSSES